MLVKFDLSTTSYLALVRVKTRIFPKKVIMISSTEKTDQLWNNLFII